MLDELIERTVEGGAASLLTLTEPAPLRPLSFSGASTALPLTIVGAAAGTEACDHSHERDTHKALHHHAPPSFFLSSFFLSPSSAFFFFSGFRALHDHRLTTDAQGAPLLAQHAVHAVREPRNSSTTWNSFL